MESRFFGRVSRAYLSSKQKQAFKKDKNAACAICGTKTKLVIDHDHSTGLIRDFLCSRHNCGIGNFSDNPELLRKAADYLELHKTPKLPKYKPFLTEFEAKEISKDLLVTLLDNPNFSSDRARARVLADRMGCSPSTAQTRLRRARKKIEEQPKSPPIQASIEKE